MINQVAIAPGDRIVPWINQCYPGWSVKPLKYMTKINARSLREDTESDFEINYIDISSVDSNGQQNPAETMTFDDAPSRARRVIASGDVIISTVRTYLKAISYIENANDNLICSTGFAVITSSPQAHPKFLFYWVRSEWFVNEIVARSVGVSYPAINAIEIGNLPFPAIKLEEQQTIADFLDRETARIDELIDRKHRLIDLLQEQRTALVTHTVTKGLNPDAPMKDSGVEWLGEIPAHWGVKKLKHVTRCLDGQRIPLNAEQRGQMQGEYPYWGANGIIDYIDSWLFDENLVLLGEDGAPFFEAGKTVSFLVRGKIWVNNHAHVLRPIESINPKLLVYMLNTVEYRSFIDGSTRDKLTQDDMRDIPIQFPPLPEQQAIADYLDQETARIDSLVGRINQAIEKLQEYRSALITAAVTGKIDVIQNVS